MSYFCLFCGIYFVILLEVVTGDIRNIARCILLNITNKFMNIPNSSFLERLKLRLLIRKCELNLHYLDDDEYLYVAYFIIIFFIVIIIVLILNFIYQYSLDVIKMYSIRFVATNSSLPSQDNV